MAIRNMTYYLLVVLLSVACVSCGPEPTCCPENQDIVLRGGVYYCLDTKHKNVTIPTNWYQTAPKINMTCKNEKKMKQMHDVFNNFYVDTNGRLFIRIMENIEYEYPRGDYCFDNRTSAKNLSMNKPTVVLCPEEKVIPVIGVYYIGICMIVSSVFLLLTAAIYVVLPELWDLQGKSIINLCVALGLYFAVLGGMDINSAVVIERSKCTILGFVVYFFLIAAFSWMSAIAIQIGLKIWTLDMSRPLMSTKWNDHKKEFLWSAAGAWGLPIVMTAVVAIVDNVSGDHVKPGIGRITCWFYNRKQQWIYQYSVMTVLIIVNIIIFGYTWRRIWSSTFKSKHVRLVRFRFWMTFKLFLVMGVLWIAVIISAYSPHIVWEIINIFNALQGVFLFIVFMWRRRVLRSLYNRGWLRCCNGPVESFLARGEDDEVEVEHTTLENPLDNIH